MTGDPPTEQAAGYYDRVATIVEWNAGPYENIYREIRRWIPTGASVVDLGCGTAPLLGALLERGGIGRYIGIDFSLESLKIAKGRFPNARFVETSLLEADLASYADAAGPRVVYAAVEVLEHIAEDRLVVERLPGGATLVATVPDFPSTGHVRTYPDVRSVFERYEDLLAIKRWAIVGVGRAGGSVHCFEGLRRSDRW